MTGVTASPRVPRHQALRDQLREQFDRGQVLPGAMLPGEYELAKLHNVSRSTVRQALDGLVREGRIERRKHVGTRVLAAPRRTTWRDFVGDLVGLPDTRDFADAQLQARLLTELLERPERVRERAQSLVLTPARPQ